MAKRVLKVKGFMRRRRYQCSQCLADVMLYPGEVMDKGQIWCNKCSEEYEKAQAARREREGRMRWPGQLG